MILISGMDKMRGMSFNLSQLILYIFLTNFTLNYRYLLQPRDTGRSDDKTGLGSLRLKIHYTSDYVFSSRFYDPLRKLILISTDVKVIQSFQNILLSYCLKSYPLIINCINFFFSKANHIEHCLPVG
jgi:hypothetical protein